MEEAPVSEIAQEILDHLRKNPRAQDTLEGISQWWLPARMKSKASSIKEALDELVDAGLIMELLGKDAQISYRMTSKTASQSNQDVTKPFASKAAKAATKDPASSD